jgi:hypothetical protein
MGGFNASFEVLLYDLTSTYFESDPPQDQDDKRRFGYSRDKRSQVQTFGTDRPFFQQLITFETRESAKSG